MTHLVEHLAMSTLPRLHHDHNASVDLALTQFTCTGRPEQVVEFLAKVCAALGAMLLAVQILQQRLTETVRHRHGLSNDVGGGATFAGPGAGERTICLDAREGQE
ncbi:hypothetical protein F4556_004909 [Kitasatospora gansuensis]|uniref:Uncharacterized protein n=1 Tax=Kitasatospora gansuensis TaxID=258050 RepID=A0A7W7SF91_9ACTN|nr:hypothetical protein [Kitasatospora gansuensis]MBB4949374.1 hypothetical protein [Kitasatospora gansuensis]